MISPWLAINASSILLAALIWLLVSLVFGFVVARYVGGRDGK